MNAPAGITVRLTTPTADNTLRAWIRAVSCPGLPVRAPVDTESLAREISHTYVRHVHNGRALPTYTFRIEYLDGSILTYGAGPILEAMSAASTAGTNLPGRTRVDLWRDGTDWPAIVNAGSDLWPAWLAAAFTHTLTAPEARPCTCMH